jgi:hypothetical protein
MRDDDDSAEQEDREKDTPTVPPRAGEQDIYESETMIGSLTPELLALMRQQDEKPAQGDAGEGEEANVPVFEGDDPEASLAGAERAVARALAPQRIPRITDFRQPPGEAETPHALPTIRPAAGAPAPGRLPPPVAPPVSTRIPTPPPPPVRAPSPPPPPPSARIPTPVPMIESDPPSSGRSSGSNPVPAPVTRPPAPPAVAVASIDLPAAAPAGNPGEPEVYTPLFAPLAGGAAPEAPPAQAEPWKVSIGLIWAIVIVGAIGGAVLTLFILR